MNESTGNPQTKEAEWIATRYPSLAVGVMVKCSACEHEIKHDRPNPTTCPNCGAKMKNSWSVPKGFFQVLDSL
jgi:rubrerythrin